ncbi:MAG: hypothetical protein PHC50_01275 [Candidatus Cloacimonetes bacterium]|nr:hypothetical protein [Candidatus Cloacimonadota bacterium]
MKTKRFIVLILFSCLFFSSLLAEDITILLDVSMSMKGFAQTGAIQQVISEFQTAIEESGMTQRTLGFEIYADPNRTDYGEILPGTTVDVGAFRGIATHLSDPIQKSKQNNYNAFLLITDNVDNSSGSTDTKYFYEAIQNTEDIKMLSVIPLIRPFKGTPYVKGIPYYNGMRGMMAYWVSYKEADENFKELKKNLRQRDFEILHFYPITGEHLRIDSADSSRSGYVLKTLEGKYILSKNQKIQLAPAIISGKESEIRFNFDLSSKYDHFYLKQDTNVKISNLNITTDSKDQYLMKVKYSISPDKLVKDMNPDGAKQSFVGILRIKAEPSLMQQLKMLINRPKLRISFDIILEAEEGGLSLTPDFEAKYFSDNEMKLDKIYSKQDLLSFINPYSNTIKLSIQNLNNKKSPESTISIKPEHESTIILGFIAFVVLIIILVYYLMIHFGVKSIAIIEDEKTAVISPHGTYLGRYFTIKNGNKRQLTITNSNWHLQNHSRSTATHVVLPGVFYLLHNEDFSETITLSYKIQ